MIIKLVPNETSFGYNAVNFYIKFEKKDFAQFRTYVASSEETVQSAQFTDAHLWKMWATRKNYVVHKYIRQYYENTYTQIALHLWDEQFNDRRMISINSFVHNASNHGFNCAEEKCSIYEWILKECFE